MSNHFSNNLEVNGWELQQARFHVAGSAPAQFTGREAGQFWYDSSNNMPKISVGAASWRRFVIANESGIGGVDPGVLNLANGKMLMGDAGGAAEVDPAVDIPVSSFAPATGDVDMGGFVLTNLPLLPSDPTDAASKHYVDLQAAGLKVKPACRLATVAALPACTNVAGTITENGAGSTLSVDGVAVVAGNRVLVKNQAAPADNGIFEVVTAGAGPSTKWVLTRAADVDTGAELTGAYTFIQAGNTMSNTGWIMTTTGTITINSTSLTWEQFTGGGSFSAGKGISFNGSVINFFDNGDYNVGALFYASGTGTMAMTGAVGTVAGGKAKLAWASATNAVGFSGYQVPQTLTGKGFLITSTTDVTEFIGGNSKVLTTNGSGDPTAGTDLPTAITIGSAYIYRVGGTDVAVADGGTGANLGPGATGGVVWKSAAGTLGVSAVGTTGYLLQSNGTSAPSFVNFVGQANTWTAAQTHTADINLSPATPASGAFANSPKLMQEGEGNNTGTVSYNRWEWRVDVSDVNATGGYTLYQDRFTTPVPTGKFNLAIEGTRTTNADDLAVILGIHGNKLRFRYRDANTGTLTQATLTGSRTWTLPNATGTLALLELAQTWTAAQTLQSANGTDVALGTRATADSGGTTRFVLDIAGKVSWGAAGASKDVSLERTAANTLSLRGVSATAVGQLIFADLDFSHYVGFKSPNTVSTSTIWTLPAPATLLANAVWRSDASGVITTVAAGTLDRVSDTNVVLTITGGTNALLSNASVTASWSGQLGLSRGGTNSDTSALAAGAVMYRGASNITGLECTADKTLMFLNNASAPTLGPTMDTAAMAANRLMFASSGSLLTFVAAPTAPGILNWDGSAFGFLNTNPARGAIGIPRIYKALVQGNGSTNKITVTHGFNTRDVVHSIRLSSTSDATYPQRFTNAKVEVNNTSANELDFYFGEVQPGSNWYVVTIVG